MSGNTQQQFTRSNSQKRAPESPASESEEVNNTNSNNKKTKLSKMDEVLLKLEKIDSSMCKLKNEVKSLSQTVEAIKPDISLIKEDLASLKSQYLNLSKENEALTLKIGKLEDDQVINRDAISEAKATINAMEQRNLANQLTIVNLPPELDAIKITSDLSKWANISLKNELKSCNVIKMKEKNAGIMFIEFWNLTTKTKFMAHVRQQQRENNNPKPILSEDIFQLDQRDLIRGTQIFFRNNLTSINKRIFDDLRNYKGKYFKHWIKGGRVMFQQMKESQPIEITSSSQLKQIF